MGRRRENEGKKTHKHDFTDLVLMFIASCAANTCTVGCLAPIHTKCLMVKYTQMTQAKFLLYFLSDHTFLVIVSAALLF